MKEPKIIIEDKATSPRLHPHYKPSKRTIHILNKDDLFEYVSEHEKRHAAQHATVIGRLFMDNTKLMVTLTAVGLLFLFIMPDLGIIWIIGVNLLFVFSNSYFERDAERYATKKLKEK